MATQGLFQLLGDSPQDIRSKYEAGLMLSPQEMGQQGLLQQVISTIAQGGTGFGYGLSRALGGKAPGEAEAEKEYAVLKEAQASGASYEDILNRIAQTTTDPRRALLASQMAAQARQERLVKEAQLAKAQKEKAIDYGKELNAIAATYINPTTNQPYNSFGELPQKLRKEAVAELQKQKEQQPVKMTSEQQIAAGSLGYKVYDKVSEYTPEEIKQIGIKLKQDREKLKQIEAGSSDKAYFNQVGGLTAKHDFSVWENQNSLKTNIEKLTTVENIIKRTPDINLGVGAEIQAKINGLLGKVGFKERMEAASDAEVLEALLGSDVFPQIKLLGIGARGLDTPAERDFLRKVLTGKITMSKDSLLRLTKIRKKLAIQAAQEHNRRIDANEYKRWEEASGKKMRKIELPRYTGFN